MPYPENILDLENNYIVIYIYEFYFILLYLLK
jgi:hypothetical protein